MHVQEERHVMYKMKLPTGSIRLSQCMQLNIRPIDAVSLIGSTAKSLEIIHLNSNSMEMLISAQAFASKLGLDSENDFSRHHRRRVAHRWGARS